MGSDFTFLRAYTSDTNCTGPTDCNPGLPVINAGSANGIAVGNQSTGLTINSGSGGVYVTSGFDGGVFEGDGGGGIYGDERCELVLAAGNGGEDDERLLS